MIIDVQNTIKGAKNGVMQHFHLSWSLTLALLVIVMVAPPFAAGGTIFSWQAADGSTTFSDRPPPDTTGITFSKFASPIITIEATRAITDLKSDAANGKTVIDATHRDIPFDCEATPSPPP